jgi:hypothetical protein
MSKYKINPLDPSTYVISKLDGNKYTRITYKHTLKHGMKLSEYKEKFGIISKDLISEQVYNSLGYTKKKSIDMYGIDEGSKKWDEYCRKQAETNTFEYKNKKYGMSKLEFREYNLKRACTLKNLIKRYGNEKGEQRWVEYCERQAYSGCSLDYFKEKYGECEGQIFYNELGKSKAVTLANMIKKYGKEEGVKRYNSWAMDIKPFHSMISEEMFIKIHKQFLNNKIYFPLINNGKEYHVYDDILQKNYFYDYVDITLGKCIEFHGDVFHGNPKLYTENDTPNFRDRSITCKEMWANDEHKINCLKRLRNIETLVIWELDYRNNPSVEIEKCINFLTS